MSGTNRRDEMPDAGPGTGDKPPPVLRYLAAAAHIGFWAGAIPLHLIRQPYDFDEYYQNGSLMGLLLAFAVTPVVTALLIAWHSKWRGFLSAHAVVALLVHVLAALALAAIAFLDPPRLDLPWLIESFLWTTAGTTLLCWLVLPFGAAFRAKDGHRAWYPVVSHLVYRHAARRTTV